MYCVMEMILFCSLLRGRGEPRGCTSTGPLPLLGLTLRYQYEKDLDQDEYRENQLV